MANFVFMRGLPGSSRSTLTTLNTSPCLELFARATRPGWHSMAIMSACSTTAAPKPASSHPTGVWQIVRKLAEGR